VLRALFERDARGNGRVNARTDRTRTPDAAAVVSFADQIRQNRALRLTGTALAFDRGDPTPSGTPRRLT
jgi:hypothetical protein